MKYLISIILISISPFISGCGKCRGIFYKDNPDGTRSKFNEYQPVNSRECFTDNIPLSNSEKTMQDRRQKGITCPPTGTRKTLISAKNFYDYRDGKVLLDLGADGTYRRIIYGEDKKSNQTFATLIGCWYQRENQVLLDSDHVAGTEVFNPMEIFTVTEAPGLYSMFRFDSSSDWSYQFCPYLDSPWRFCTLLRNGNDFFWPTGLTPSQKADLTKEALLMRKLYNYTDFPIEIFNKQWESPQGIELGRSDLKYAVVHIPDTPRYIDQAWRDFIKGDRPTMPDLTSEQTPPVCYVSYKTVTLDDGSSSRIKGEACYVNGVYIWTAAL